MRTSSPWVGLLKTLTRASPASSRASSSFCTLPPESVAILVRTSGVRMLNSSTSRSAKRSISSRRSVPARQNGRRPIRLSTAFIAHVEVGDDALAEPVVGDVAQPAALALADPEPGHVLAEEQHRPRARAALAGDQLRELALSVAVDARDAEDLPGPQLEPDIAQADGLVVAVEGEPAGRERNLAELARRQLAAHRHRLDLDRGGELGGLVAEHHLDDPRRQLLLGPPAQVVGRERADHAPGAQHRHPVAELDRLVQLVGDEDDRQPLGGQVARAPPRSSS